MNIARFCVKMAKTKTLENGPALVMKRRGVITWKLVKIYIADSFLKN